MSQFLRQHYDSIEPNPNRKQVLLQFLHEMDEYGPMDFLMEELQNKFDKPVKEAKEEKVVKVERVRSLPMLKKKRDINLLANYKLF